MASFIRGVFPPSRFDTRKASGQLHVSAYHLYVVGWIVMMDNVDDNNDEDDEDDKNDEDDKDDENDEDDKDDKDDEDHEDDEDDVAMVDVNFRYEWVD